MLALLGFFASCATESTAECVAKAWLSADLPCQCAPAESLRSAQCDEGSCVQNNVYVYLADGTYSQAIIQRGNRSFSAVGGNSAVTRGTWSVAGEKPMILTQGSERRQWSRQVSCSDDALQPEHGPRYRAASSGLGDALANAAESGEWTDQPLR